METGEIIQNGGLVIGGGLVTQLMNWGRDWWRSRQSVKVEQPVEVAKRHDYVTVGECKSKMCEMGQRIDRVADGQQKILDKLDQMDDRSEQRAKETHARIDPLVKEIAKNIGQVELIKESFLKATIGGKK